MSPALSLAALAGALFVSVAVPTAAHGASAPPAISTAASTILVVSFTAPDTTPPPSQEPALYTVNGEPPLAVGRASATVFEERCTDWNSQRYPQLIGHRIYLQLRSPLAEGSVYELSYPGGSQSFTFRATAIACESFRVNQVGYNPLSSHPLAFWYAWCGDLKSAAKPGAPSEVFLCDASGKRLGPVPVSPTKDDPRNGAPVARLDLSKLLVAPGSYYLLAPGIGRSATFGYGDTFTHHAFYTHLRGLFHQRCGQALAQPFTAWERPACHTDLEITDAPPPDFIKQHGAEHLHHESGGYHDAGDFDSRLAHTLVPGWLLNAYELFPKKFTDGQLAIPESGNGIPDLLDEALHGIQLWEILQAEDGGIRAGFESEREPIYGEVNAATDRFVYRTFARHGHTTLAGGALMAYASRLVRPFDAQRAEALLARAVRAWEFYEHHREDPAYHWTHGPLLFASGQLYLATGDAKFHDVFRAEARYVFDLEGQKSKWPAQYNNLSFNLPNIDEGAIFTHYFISYVLEEKRATDPEIVRAARTAIQRRADEILGKLGDGFATTSLEAWGMSTGVGRSGDLLIHAWRLTSDSKYLEAATRLADWSLGANPPGWCFTTGLGTRPPHSPLHLDSYAHLRTLGPVPGIVIYGFGDPGAANRPAQAVLQHLYPAFKDRPPAQRLTDGWSVVIQNEFTVWETMAPNCFLHACLAPEKPLAGQLLPFTNPLRDLPLDLVSSKSEPPSGK